VAATHLYTSGLKLHIENALGYGATPHEVMEVIELASPLGMAGVNMALPIVFEELANASGVGRDQGAERPDRSKEGTR
jgi:alkylhydroperoxidase/carboxymuconolactone decarboxylase family protein YurZ